jgi:hypothetical protein
VVAGSDSVWLTSDGVVGVTNWSVAVADSELTNSPLEVVEGLWLVEAEGEDLLVGVLAVLVVWEVDFNVVEAVGAGDLGSKDLTVVEHGKEWYSAQCSDGVEVESNNDGLS